MPRWQEPMDLDYLDQHRAPVNAKGHAEEEIAASVSRFGFIEALVLDERTGVLLGGHGRLDQLRRRREAGEAPPEGIEVGPGGEWLIPVNRGWSSRDDAEATAAAIALNRLVERGGWDERALVAQLEPFRENGGLEGTGFEADDLARLLGAFQKEDFAQAPQSELLDEAPPRPRIARSESGQLWQLGPHRLLVGDATNASDLGLLMVGEAADLVWTDPPYGVAIVGGSHQLSPEERLARGGQTIENDALESAALSRLLEDAFLRAADACRPGAAWFVSAPAGPLFAVFAAALADLGIWRQTLVWMKDVFVMGRSDYHYRHEALFYGWKPGASHHPPPDRKQDTIFEFPRPKRSTEHPTMKPVALIERAIENHTDLGDIVLDPFAGSGSTLIAAHKAGRSARLLDIDPIYVDVVLTRYQALTGEKPVLAETGEPHDFGGP